jgi:hypothetical protein
MLNYLKKIGKKYIQKNIKVSHYDKENLKIADSLNREIEGIRVKTKLVIPTWKTK